MANPLAKIKESLREFSITTLAVDNATSVFLLTIMILLFGLNSYDKMPKEQFPEAVFPTIFVNTPYPGNSAQDIENLITRPIEKELQGITGIKDIKSTSIQDFSIITAEFTTDSDPEIVKRKVKDAVDKSKSELPNDLPADPAVVDVNLADIPIMTVNLSGDYSMDNLKSISDELKDRLEEISEVNKVDIKGAMEREVQIDVDLTAIQARQISFGDIENAIRSENMNMSGGEIVNNEFRRAIRVVGEFESIDELRDMIVKSEAQTPVYLRDIADVTFGYKDRTSIARSNGFPVISLDVIKRKGENLLNCADAVNKVVEESKINLFPGGLRVSVFNDQSINTRNQVSNLENSIISGVILVVLVLLFFLGIRNAMFVGIAIPLSMLTGIMLLYLSGVTMNIVVLFALILALGLLVDNGIVVVENIYRYMQEGYSAKDASKYGAGEVAIPIIVSTATTLAAFFPLAFWPGLIGEFMKYFPITLVIVLTSSLFVALVINPVFTASFMKIDERSDDPKVRRRKLMNGLIMTAVLVLIAIAGHVTNTMWVRNLFGIIAIVTLVNVLILRAASMGFQNTVLPFLERIYDKFVRFALKKLNPVIVFFGSFVLLIAVTNIYFGSDPKMEQFPSADPLYVNVFVDLPLGKDITATDKIMTDIEAKVDETIAPYKDIVEEVLSQIGENTSDPNAPPEPGASPNKARLTVSFVPYEKRNGVSSMTVMNEIRKAVGDQPGVQIAVDKNADGPPTGKPINIELAGDDVAVLSQTSQDMIQYINESNIGGIEELKADVKIGKPELVINIDREAARRFELSTFSIADAIRTSVYGKEISKYKQGEDEYDIFVRLDKDKRYDINELLNQRVTFRNPANGRIVQIPISAVATAEYSSTFSSVKRINLDRAITISSNVLSEYNANDVVAEIKGELENFEFPEGVNYKFTGAQEQQAQDTEFLLGAFAVAIFSIFLIIVAQFNSVVAPFIIILSIVFSLTGVFLGYYLTGSVFQQIFSGVGVISLAGIVVNNAIVLIDYINLLIKRKRTENGVESLWGLNTDEVKEAIVVAGATRLRPVLLTAITTVLGLIPLAIGFNFNFFTLISDLDPNIIMGGDNTAIWGPMALTVIYGLTFATFLTLVVVPAMYWLSYRFNRWARGLFKAN